MNYTINEANKIRVGDTLTLEDSSRHEAVEDERAFIFCQNCSINGTCTDANHPQCGTYSFHFKQMKP